MAVFGTGKIEVTPDELRWSISLKTLGGTVAEVSKNHIEDVSGVLNYLNKSGLSADGVKIILHYRATSKSEEQVDIRDDS